jgi:hypothetical protein
MKPIQKFRNGIHRIMRICMKLIALFITARSYRTTAFSELMEEIQRQNKIEKDIKNSKKRSIFRKSIPKTREERNEVSLITIIEKVEALYDLVEGQDQTMKIMKLELNQKIERLKCYEEAQTPKGHFIGQNIIESRPNNNIEDISIERVRKNTIDKDDANIMLSSPIPSLVIVPSESKYDKDLDYILSLNTEELFNDINNPKGTFESVSDFTKNIEESKKKYEFDSENSKNDDDSKESWETAKFAKSKTDK